MRKISSLLLLSVMLTSPLLKGMKADKINISAIDTFTRLPLTMWDIDTAQNYLDEVTKALAKKPTNKELNNLKTALERGIASLRHKLLLGEIKAAKDVFPEPEDAITNELEELAAKDDPKDDQKRIDLLNKKLKTTGDLSLEEYRDLAWLEKIGDMDVEVILGRLKTLERENNPQKTLRRIWLWHQKEAHFGLTAQESKILKQLENPLYMGLDAINAELGLLEKMNDPKDDLRRIDLLRQKQALMGGPLEEKDSTLLDWLTAEQSKLSTWLQKIKSMNEAEIDTELKMLKQENLQKEDIIRRITRLKQKKATTGLTKAESKALSWLQEKYFPSLQTDPNRYNF